ncbi:MAG: prolipoprotein diacylglyceryl transferase [Thermoguttaceae bacterium]|nr:prolipoprotein diacylglyceryl transferase [Thermoguttaceae bacterium]
MRPTLFHIPPELFGIPLFGFGLLFWGIVAVTVVMSLRSVLAGRKEDLLSDLLLGAVAAALVAWVAPVVGDAEGFPIRGYGLFLMLAIVAASLVVVARGKKQGLSPEHLLPIIVVQVVCGLIGARIFYLLEYWDQIRSDTLIHTVIRAIDLTKGGLVVYGGIIGGIVGSYVYLKKKKLPILQTLDVFAPALMLGIALGRLGCFMNGCCFGGPCDCPVGVHFPVASPAHFAQMENGLAPLGGFILEEPSQHAEAKGSIFSIKKAYPRLRGDIPGPVRIASVVPDSEAAKAGLVPGMTVLRVGLIPAEGREEPRPSDQQIEQAATFPIRCNDDLFRFMLYESGSLSSSPVVIFDVEDPNAEKPSDAEKPSNAEKPSDTADAADADSAKQNDSRFVRLAFHAGPYTVLPVHPTQLYSSVSALALFVILLLLSRWCHRPGVLFAWMLILYALTRFCLELVRTDELSFCGTGLSVSQCVSVVMLVIAIGLLIYSRRAAGEPSVSPGNASRTDGS